MPEMCRPGSSDTPGNDRRCELLRVVLSPCAGSRALDEFQQTSCVRMLEKRINIIFKENPH